MASPSLGQTRIPIDLGPDAKTQGDGPPQVLDVLAAPPAPDTPTAAEALECDDQADAGEISGEIVVCRSLVDNSDRLAGSYADWLKDYAERSMNFNTISAPNVDNTDFRFPGIYASVSIAGCWIPPCPRFPPALLIDVDALPAPPIGTDADRVAQGLAPRGQNGEYTREERRRLEAELGLPPKPDFSKEAEK